MALSPLHRLNPKAKKVQLAGEGTREKMAVLALGLLLYNSPPNLLRSPRICTHLSRPLLPVQVWGWGSKPPDCWFKELQGLFTGQGPLLPQLLSAT